MPSFVAYLDILGFSRFMREDAEAAEMLLHNYQLIFNNKITDDKSHPVAEYPQELKKMDELGLDAMVYENKTQVLGTNNVNLARLINLISTVIRYPLTKKSYKAFINQLDYSLAERNDIYPSIYPNWDRSPRLGYCAELLTNATPELFYKHIKKVLKVIKGKPDKDKVLFLKSWNEWAEGNYIEPDLEYGKQRITMLRKALDEDV